MENVKTFTTCFYSTDVKVWNGTNFMCEDDLSVQWLTPWTHSSTRPVLRIRDVYPGSWILIFTHLGSQISDPRSKNNNKREGWKKICFHNFLCSHKFHKIANYFSFEVLKKKIWANFQRIIELFTQKIVTKYGFGIRDPGVIPDPDSQHWTRWIL